MSKRTWSKRSLGSLRGIHPDLRRVFDRALHESPLDFIVIEGLRSEDRQRELVASGASQTMNSRHLTGHAVDILPIGPDGKAAFAWPLYDRVVPVILRIAQEEGVALEWGGHWQTFKDGPHFQLARDQYPAAQPFDAVPVTRTQTAMKAAGEAKSATAAGATAAASALGSVAASATNAPEPIQWALAAVIVIAAAFFVWREVAR